MTNRRIIISSGVLGIDFRSVDLGKMADISVNVNPLLFNKKMIKISTLANSSDNKIIMNWINNPYETYNLIQKVKIPLGGII